MPTQLTRSLCYAAAMRIARFGTANEFGDWITALHTFTYCNALAPDFPAARVGGANRSRRCSCAGSSTARCPCTSTAS